MQNLSDKFKEYSDILNTDFSDWEDDFFGENEQFSDVANGVKARNLIQNLRSSNNRSCIQNTVPPLSQEEILRRKSIIKSNWKEIKLSKLGTLNASPSLSLQKEHKQIDILNRDATASNIRKCCDESSDSEDFDSPNKKLKKSKIHPVNVFSNQNKDRIRTRFSLNSVKSFQDDRSSVKEIPLQEMPKSQSDLKVISRKKSPESQTECASNQESCKTEKITFNEDLPNSQKMSISSQESCKSEKITFNEDLPNSQKMSISSQENSPSEKMITSSQEISASQKMSTSSQENSLTQKMSTSSQETCTKMITSSQESLGKHVMNISIKDESNFFNIASQSSSGAQVVNTPRINCLKRFSRERRKTDSSDKNNFTEIVSSVSDSFYNKNFKRCNKATEKRMIWNLRRKELEMTKREEAVKNREKFLDAREASIRKNEAILKAKQRRYFWCKVNLKRFIQNQTCNSKELLRK